MATTRFSREFGGFKLIGVLGHLDPSPGATKDAGLPARPSCATATTQPYVLSSDGVLYSFDPPNRKFTKVAPLACSAAGMTPNSMAIDREGIAWVNLVEWGPEGTVVDGGLFRASTVDGSCEPAGAELPVGWKKIGMAFWASSLESHAESLYVAASTSKPCTDGLGTSTGLGRLDVSLVEIGEFSGEVVARSVELTGTGDGRLYGLFTGPLPSIARVDVATAVTSKVVPLPDIACPIAFAFSFWGGDLYLYTSFAVGVPSTVTRYSLSDGTIDTNYVPSAGIEIVGAGVSTCAPVTQEPR